MSTEYERALEIAEAEREERLVAELRALNRKARSFYDMLQAAVEMSDKLRLNRLERWSRMP